VPPASDACLPITVAEATITRGKCGYHRRESATADSVQKCIGNKSQMRRHGVSKKPIAKGGRGYVIYGKLGNLIKCLAKEKNNERAKIYRIQSR
jgi:hypothetical protein